MARAYQNPPIPSYTNPNYDPDDDELDEDAINAAAASQAADTVVGDEDAADYEPVPTVLPSEGGPPSDDQTGQEVPVNTGPDSAGSGEDELYDPSTANLKQGGNIEADLMSNTEDDEQDLDAIGTLDDSGAGTDTEMPIDDEDAAVTDIITHSDDMMDPNYDANTETIVEPEETVNPDLVSNWPSDYGDDLPESDPGDGGNIGNETEEAKTFQELLEENLMAKMMEDAQSAGQRDAGRAIAAARAQAGRGQMGMSGGILAAQSDAVSNAVANAEDRLFGQQMQAGRLGAGIETEERNLLLNAIAVREDLGLEDDEFRALLEGIGLNPDALPELGGGDDEPEEEVIVYDNWDSLLGGASESDHIAEIELLDGSTGILINTSVDGVDVPAGFEAEMTDPLFPWDDPEPVMEIIDGHEHYVYTSAGGKKIFVRADRSGHPMA